MFILTLSLIILRPFFSEWIFPVSFFYYETVLLILAALHFILNPKTRRLMRHPLMKVWGGWVLLSGFSLLVHSKESFPWQGWMPFLMNGIFFLLAATYASDPLRRQWLMAALLTGLLGTLVIASIQWNADFPYLREHLDRAKFAFSDRNFLEDFLSRRRVLGPFFSPDLFACYLVMISFVALAFLFEVKKKFFLVIFLAAVGELFFTRSLGGWMSLLAGMGILLTLPLKGGGKGWGFIFILLLAGVILLIQRSQAVFAAGSLHHSLFQRLSFWKSAWEIFLYSPLLGTGFGRFGQMYHYFQQSGAFQTNYAHNIVLQLLAEFGVFGGIWFCYWVGVFTGTARRSLASSQENFSSNKALVTALVVFFIHNLVDFGFSVPQVSDHWWIIAGLLVNPKFFR